MTPAGVSEDAAWLPPLPELPEALLEEHHGAHVALDDALRCAHPGVGRIWSRFALRTAVGALANIRPSLRGSTGPPLFPSPRAFLGLDDLARLAGARAAFVHVDGRLAMVDQGYEEPPALLPETPYVLHALVEGPVENPIGTNPGMVRGKEFASGGLPASGRQPPTHERCRRLMAKAVLVAGDSRAPAPARAAWIMHGVGEIHPFQDGNGRVARLLYLLAAGDAMPRSIDWGVLEQFRFHERLIVDADRTLDATAMAVTATELSIAGARLMTQRLAVLGAIVPELAHRLGFTLEAAVLAVAAWLRRAAQVADLAEDVGWSYGEALAVLRSLEAFGLVRRGGSQRAPDKTAPTGAGPTMTVSDGLRAEVGLLVHAAAGAWSPVMAAGNNAGSHKTLDSANPPS